MPPVTIIYAAIGEGFIRGAGISARSAKAVMPQARTILWADRHARCASLDEVLPLRPDPAIQPEIRRTKILKIEAILQAAEDLEGPVIFLDTDTFVAESLLPALDLLQRSDIAVAHDTWRCYAGYDWTTPFNSGVILFRAGPRVAGIFRAWRDLYRDTAAVPDQVSFHRVLTESELRIALLPPEMNARCGEPLHLSGRVKVVHKHDSRDPLLHPAVLARLLNQVERNRVFIPAERRLSYLDEQFQTRHLTLELTPELEQLAREARSIDCRTTPW